MFFKSVFLSNEITGYGTIKHIYIFALSSSMNGWQTENGTPVAEKFRLDFRSKIYYYDTISKKKSFFVSTSLILQRVLIWIPPLWVQANLVNLHHRAGYPKKKMYLKGDFLFLCTLFNTASSAAPHAGIEPRTVATFSDCSNHSTRA